MNPQDRIAQLDASVAALWARMNNISNAGGQVVIIGGSGGTGAPSAAQYLVLAADAGLGVERILTMGSGLQATDSGAGAAYTMALGPLTALYDQSGAFNWVIRGGDLLIANSKSLKLYSDNSTTPSTLKAVIDGSTGFAAFGDGTALSTTEILNANATFTDPSSGVRGLHGLATLTMTANSTRILEGMLFVATVTGSTFTKSGSTIGIDAQVNTGSNVTHTGEVRGISAQITPSTGGTVTTVKGITVVTPIGSGNTVTNWYGIYIPVPTGGSGTLTNGYGLYIENQNKGGTINRAIESLGGISTHLGAWAIGSNTAPVASALTEWTSTTQGLKPPNMTTTQRDAIGTPATSLLVYNTTTNTYDYYDGTAWRQIDVSDGNKIDIVSTTDATVTTLATVTIPATTTVQIEARVSARRTGGSGGTAEDGAAYVRRAAIKNVAGTATIIGAVGTDFTAEDQAGWDCTIDVTAATARVRVTGATNNNINWKSEVRTLNVS